MWPAATSPRGAKDSTGPFPSPCKGTETQSSAADKSETELSGCKTEQTERDDLDDVLWGGVESGVRMEMECMEDSFTKELLEFQLEETETKSENKRIAYIGDALAEKLIRYVKKLYKQLEACSDILDTFPPAHQQTPYKVGIPALYAGSNRQLCSLGDRPPQQAALPSLQPSQAATGQTVPSVRVDPPDVSELPAQLQTLPLPARPAVPAGPQPDRNALHAGGVRLH